FLSPPAAVICRRGHAAGRHESKLDLDASSHINAFRRMRARRSSHSCSPRLRSRERFEKVSRGAMVGTHGYEPTHLGSRTLVKVKKTAPEIPRQDFRIRGSI
ncbi:hypothetical protein BRADI_1g42943v3, partial [Brachypodium distachyon]